jgi:GntR family transcriptional regulator, transcriptional repressor for pyruvate dehydrogenase complex
MSSQKKVYLEIVHEIRSIIEADRLIAGDKLPSERELSDRLHVGRSSVREALRALELLGLIETKRGEGTFIKEFHGHQLVELIGTFVLQDEKTKKDLVETKIMLEFHAISNAVNCITEENILQLEKWIRTVKEPISHEDHLRFIRHIMDTANNRLVLRMWLIVSEYYLTFSRESYKSVSHKDYVLLFDSLKSNDRKRAEGHYLTSFANQI